MMVSPRIRKMSAVDCCCTDVVGCATAAVVTVVAVVVSGSVDDYISMDGTCLHFSHK